MRQVAPRPDALFELVGMVSYRPGWTFRLDDIDRGQGSEGLTLVITTCGYDSYHPDRGENYRVHTTCGYDSYHPDRGENYRVHHYMPVPPAAYDRRSWRRWLFEQLLLVERHEAMEFFRFEWDEVVEGREIYLDQTIRHVERPYAPHHGPGNDPYIVFDLGTDEDRRTSFRGDVKR
ncbi:MAG TPA: hypothetical protein VFJ85_02770 [Acidimicrobiales bacterium]|nr:hypothetical protein [Acidimicrobiales bacterium]